MTGLNLVVFADWELLKRPLAKQASLHLHSSSDEIVFEFREGKRQGLGNSSLNALLNIFPTFVFGRSVLKYTCFGTLYPVSDFLQ